MNLILTIFIIKKDNNITIYSPNIHEGVIGIIASRIKRIFKQTLYCIH